MKSTIRLFLWVVILLVAYSARPRFLTLTLDGNTTPSLNNTTVHISAGAYTATTIQNITGSTIIADAGVSFTGGINLTTLSHVTLSGFSLLNISGDGVTMHGHSEYLDCKKWLVSNVSGNVFNANTQAVYNGSISSLILYYFRFDSSTVRHSGRIMQGSFGGAGQGIAGQYNGTNPTNYMDSVQFDHNYILNTVDNGIQYRGTAWRVGWNYNRTVYDTTTNKGYGVNPILGDVGLIYLNGSLTMHDNFTKGGRGYDFRLWTVILNGRQDKSQYYNNVRAQTWTYGAINPTSTNTDGNQESNYTILGGNVYAHHNTYAIGNDDITYWSPFDLHGTSTNMFLYLHNNLVIQVMENYPGHTYNSDQLSKSKILSDQSNGTKTVDSANNRYISSYVGLYDTLTGQKINSAVTAFPGIGAEPGTTSNPINEPPVAVPTASPNPVVQPSNSTTLNGSGSTDPENGPLIYAWSIISGSPSPTLSSPNTAVTTASGMTSVGTYGYRLTVTDNMGNSSFSNINVTVTGTNQAPVSIIHGDSIVTYPGTAANVNGVSSYDPDNNIPLTYLWSIAGPNSPTFSSTTVASPTISALIPGTYMLTLKVSDSKGAFNNSTKMLIVNAAPGSNTANYQYLYFDSGSKPYFIRKN
jgi:hypothetical protein